MTEIVIPPWIKRHDLVKLTPTGDIVQVMTIDAQKGTLETRGAVSNATQHRPLDKFAPATVQEKIRYSLAAARVKGFKSILLHNQDDHQYRVLFGAAMSLQAIEKIDKLVPSIFASVEHGDYGCIVTVKPAWITEAAPVDPTYSDSQAAADVSVSVADLSESDRDSRTHGHAGNVSPELAPLQPLTETARHIKELQERNALLIVQRDFEIDRADQLAKELKKADAFNVVLQDELDRVGMADLSDRSVTPTQQPPALTYKEWEIVTGAQKEELGRRESQGWQIAHMQFEMGKLNLVYYRITDKPATPNGAQAAAKLVQPVGPQVIIQPVPADPHVAVSGFRSDRLRPQQHRNPLPLMPLNQNEPARNFGLIAHDRATYQSMLNDMTINTYDFTLAVRNSRLPRPEKDALVEQGVKLRSMHQARQMIDNLHVSSIGSFRPSLVGGK